jgi:hypothetical protein
MCISPSWGLRCSFVWFTLKRCQGIEYSALNGRMIDQLWIGKNLEGSGRGLIKTLHRMEGHGKITNYLKIAGCTSQIWATSVTATITRSVIGTEWRIILKCKWNIRTVRVQTGVMLLTIGSIGKLMRTWRYAFTILVTSVASLRFLVPSLILPIFVPFIYTWLALVPWR